MVLCPAPSKVIRVPIGPSEPRRAFEELCGPFRLDDVTSLKITVAISSPVGGQLRVRLLKYAAAAAAAALEMWRCGAVLQPGGLSAHTFL